MKMVNIGYVSLIPQNLEGILEDLIDGGGGSGGAGAVFFTIDENGGILDPDGEPLTFNALVEIASSHMCVIKGVSDDGLNYSYFISAMNDEIDGNKAIFGSIYDGELLADTYSASSATDQLVFVEPTP